MDDRKIKIHLFKKVHFLRMFTNELRAKVFIALLESHELMFSKMNQTTWSRCCRNEKKEKRNVHPPR